MGEAWASKETRKKECREKRWCITKAAEITSRGLPQLVTIIAPEVMERQKREQFCCQKVGSK